MHNHQIINHAEPSLTVMMNHCWTSFILVSHHDWFSTLDSQETEHAEIMFDLLNGTENFLLEAPGSYKGHQ